MIKLRRQELCTHSDFYSIMLKEFWQAAAGQSTLSSSVSHLQNLRMNTPITNENFRGDDNLIKCNRIPSESATGESLGYSTHSNAEISRICSFDIHS